MTTDRKQPEINANVVWQASAVTRPQHEKQNGHRAAVVWLTGLPGSGKSTIARNVEQNLHRHGLRTVVLDGDNMRHGLCSDLGFSVADRNENVRRVSEVAKLFLEQGTIVLVALVSPIRDAREQARHLIPSGDFFEVYCQCPLAVCQQRDPKGLYAKVAKGMLGQFTGISSPYEEPLDPAITLDTADESATESVQRLTEFLLAQLRIAS